MAAASASSLALLLEAWQAVMWLLLEAWQAVMWLLLAQARVRVAVWAAGWNHLAGLAPAVVRVHADAAALPFAGLWRDRCHQRRQRWCCLLARHLNRSSWRHGKR